MTDLAMSSAGYQASGKSGFGQELVTGSGRFDSSPLDGVTAYTVEYFVKATGGTGLELDVAQQANFWIAINANGILEARYGRNPNEQALISTVNLNDGNYHHIALSVGENGGKLFCDGLAVASSAVTLIQSTPEPNKYLGVKSSFAGTSDNIINELVLWGEQKYLSDFTPPTEPYSGNEANLIGLYHFDGDGTDSAGNSPVEPVDPIEPEPEEPVEPEEPDPIDPPVEPVREAGEISPDTAEIVYSPYNWNVTPSYAKTVNPGAYLKFSVSTSSCVLKFDVSEYTAEVPRLFIVVDGVTSQEELITDRVTINLDTNIADQRRHIEIYFDAATEYTSRWTTNESAAVLTGIVLDTNATLYAASVRNNKIIIFGDSITEGVLTRGSAANYVGKNSAIGCYPLLVAERNNAEIGVIGFGGSGMNSYGGGGVPRLKDSYKLIYDGVTRDFSSPPDLCIWNEGTNDGSGDTVANGLTALNGMLSAMPNTQFLIMRPFNGTAQEGNLVNIIAQCSDPSRVTYKSTDGFYNGSGGVHPKSFSSRGTIADGVSGLVTEALKSIGYTGETSTATVEAKGIPDGTYKTTLNLNGECVFYGDLTYTNNFATATGVKCAVGNKLTGSVFDNQGNHTKCAGLTSTSF